MNDRVCYIRRSDRGAVLRSLRLIGTHTDDTWQGSGGADPLLVGRSINEGARWIRDRLGAGTGKSRVLSVLCLDTDGAVCSWVKPEDADESLLTQATDGTNAEIDPDALEPETHSGLSERFPQMPMELSFEFLDDDQTSTGSRAAVMATPDIPGRLLKDELDAIGIRVEKFTTIWHALACVWDPGAGDPSKSAQRIVSSDAPIAAVIAIDADDGRLIWSWSRGGELITAGSSRIAIAQSEHEPLALIREQDIARLCSDWLGWSSQLGIAPSRIVLVGQPNQIESLADPSTPDPGTAENNPTPTKRGLSAGEIGQAITRAWPDALVDLIEHRDPVGETLSRIASGAKGDTLGSLITLESRPVRAHRSMYRWAGVALVAVSIAISLLGVELFTQARAIQDQTRLVEIHRAESINNYDPELIMSPFVKETLNAKLGQIRKSQGPLVVVQSKPILEELETLSFVFGVPGVEILSARLNNSNATVKIRVDDLSQAVELNLNLNAIKGSHLRWHSMNPVNRGQQIEATYSARWGELEDES